MNVAAVCKYIPAYLPHEVLGFPRDSLPGMLLTIDMVKTMVDKENETVQDKAGQTSRINKFKKNR